MGETLKLTDSESVEIVGSGAQGLEVEATYGPGGSAPPKHLHPAQDERFRVIEGRIRAVAGEQRARARGRGRARDPARRGAPDVEPVRGARARLLDHEPGRAHRGLVSRGRRVGARGRAGGVGGALSFGALLDEYDDTFRLAVGPAPVVGVAVKALGFAGRLTGHGPDR